MTEKGPRVPRRCRTAPPSTSFIIDYYSFERAARTVVRCAPSRRRNERCATQFRHERKLDCGAARTPRLRGHRTSRSLSCRTTTPQRPHRRGFIMRSIVVSLLTLLLLAGSHARAQVPGPVDPTGLKPRWFYIDGVRYELLLP